MSRGQLARTPDNFPRMKHRAAGRKRRDQYRHEARRRADMVRGLLFNQGPRIASYGGGYRCAEHGIVWNWGEIGQAEYDEIQAAIEDHEATHDFDEPDA
jgi:hypothetical protein